MAVIIRIIGTEIITGIVIGDVTLLLLLVTVGSLTRFIDWIECG
jgi:hypothetical protein